MHDLDILYRNVEVPSTNSRRKPSMVEVHLNPKELDDLTHLQGSAHYNNAGVPVFNKLWKEFLSHDRIQDALHHHIREGHRDGGMISVHEERLRHDGRHGDSRTALMPRPMAEYLEEQFGKSINPYDGKPEFYLGDLLRGASRYLSPLASSLYNMGSAAYRGMSRAGSAAYRGAASAGRGISSAAGNLYNRLPNNPFRREARAPNAPRTWAGTFGDVGRGVGGAAGHYGGDLVGRAAGAYFGPQIGRAAASALPIPGIISGPLGSLAGGLAGMPLGGFVGRQGGRRVGEYGGEQLGRLAGRGIDFVADRMGAPMQRMAAATAPYREAVSNTAGRAGNRIASTLSTINSYSPASLFTDMLARNPELISRVGRIAETTPRGGSPRAAAPIEDYGRGGSTFGMAGFTDEASMPLLGVGGGRRRSGSGDSTSSFMTARSEPDLWPAIDEPD